MTKKLLPVLNIVASVLLVAAFFVNVLTIYTGVSKDTLTPYSYVVTIALLVTVLFAIYYLLAGCKKEEGAKYFTWFMNVYALIQLILLLQHADMTIVAVMLIALSFGCLTVLSTAKDLGKKKSVLLTGIISLCAALQFITAACSGSLAGSWVKIGTLTLLGLTSLLMVFGKYADKQARGTK